MRGTAAPRQAHTISRCLQLMGREAAQRRRLLFVSAGALATVSSVVKAGGSSVSILIRLQLTLDSPKPSLLEWTFPGPGLCLWVFIVSLSPLWSPYLALGKNFSPGQIGGDPRGFSPSSAVRVTGHLKL